jgi:hypothetical protein
MTATSMTSQLEAVNTLLESIGETRVNSLDATGFADVASAIATLTEISRAVQTVGYHFNTESEYPLPRDNANRIPLPTNVLKVTVQGSSGIDITQRGSRLYDKTNHRDTFEGDQTGAVVLMLPWDDLPQSARTYIMVRGARVFQARTLGSDTQFRFSAEEEMDAEKVLNESEGETGNYNIFTGSNSVTSIMER